MQTPTTPKWIPSHLAVNSARVVNDEEMLRTWSAIAKEMLCKRQQPQMAPFTYCCQLRACSKWSAIGKEIVRAMPAIVTRAIHEPPARKAG